MIRLRRPAALLLLLATLAGSAHAAYSVLSHALVAGGPGSSPGHVLTAGAMGQPVSAPVSKGSVYTFQPGFAATFADAATPATPGEVMLFW